MSENEPRASGAAAPPAGTGDAEALARRFHEAYERLAPSFGYETRPESAKPWEEVPEQNRKLMVAVCAEVLRALATVPAGPGIEWTPDLSAAVYRALEDSLAAHALVKSYGLQSILAAQLHAAVKAVLPLRAALAGAASPSQKGQSDG